MSEKIVYQDNAMPGDVLIMKDGKLHKCIMTFCSKLSKYVFAERMIIATDKLKEDVENGIDEYKMGDVVTIKHEGHNDIVLTIVDNVGVWQLMAELMKLSREVLTNGFQRISE